MLGNILILTTLVSYGFIANLMLKPKPGGDYGVGYSFALLIYAAGFIISTGLLAWNMNLNHCFDWTAVSFLRYRNWLVFLGWTSFVVAMFWSLEYSSKKVEDAFPAFINWFTWSRIYIWLPLLMLLPALYLLNVQRVPGVAPFWVKTAMQTDFSFSFLITLIIFGIFCKISVQRRIGMFQTRMDWYTERQSAYNTSLEYIKNYNEATITGLLKYTSV